MKNNQAYPCFRILLVLLVVAMTLFVISCGSEKSEETTDEPKTFTFQVVPLEGEAQTFTITSSRKTVGDALFDEKLIEGENGAFGLYVKKVNGITADYNIDKTYWAFYVNGEYGMSGVDMTPIEDGAVYAFRQEVSP